MPDRDDKTRYCPHGSLCESCGHPRELRIVAVETTSGTLCATLCPSCHEQQALPAGLCSLLAGARAARHSEHATSVLLAHVGDQMTAHGILRPGVGQWGDDLIPLLSPGRALRTV